MRVRVDASLCAAGANCVSTCPEVFKLKGEVAEVRGDVVPEQNEAVCRRVADQCPTGAISIEE